MKNAHNPRPFAVRASTLHKIVATTIQRPGVVVHQTVGPESVPLQFCSDAMVVFEFPAEWDAACAEKPSAGLVNALANTEQHIVAAHRFRYMTAFLTCFNSALKPSNELEPPPNAARYITAYKCSHGWDWRDNGTCNLARTPVGDPLGIGMLDDAVAKFNAIEKSSANALSLDVLAQFYRVAYHRQLHDPQTALVLAWTLTERCQNLLWKRFLETEYKHVLPRPSLTSERKKSLEKDSRTYSASVRSQILAFAGIFSDADMERLDQVRSARNKFMHEMKAVSDLDAFIAQCAAANLMKVSLGIDVQPFGNPGAFHFTD